MQLEDKGLSSTTIKIYLTLVKVIINYAKKRKMVTYETDPFDFCRMPAANIRKLDLTIEEIKAIRDVELNHYNLRVVRDIFMLSYYLAGINLVDLNSSGIYQEENKNRVKGRHHCPKKFRAARF